MPSRSRVSDRAERLTAVPLERSRFHTLLSVNPNYFGTLDKSPWPTVKPLQQQTTYEELVCIGLQPETSQLEAVVHLKQGAGYNGSLCSGGSTEFVRFYISYDDGATWQDVGQAQFAAHDVGGAKPLEYGLTRPVLLDARLCRTERLIRVRAILSWNVAPNAGDPGFRPVWGNVAEAVVQVAPRRRIKWADLATEVQLSSEIGTMIGPEQELSLQPAVELGASELHELYAKADVPAHRYLLKALDSPVSLSVASFAPAMEIGSKSAFEVESGLAQLNFDPAKLIDAVLKTQGDTTYEELTCLGFDPNNDALVGVVNVKLSSGYSGGLCTAGSREYVAFWVDWGDGSGWQYAGTTSFAAHDLNSLPPEGLKYAVFEAVNVSKRRRQCQDGPVLAKVRAILSWQAAPSSSDPDWIPTWGNRRETEILLDPRAAADYKPILESVSGVPVCNINQATGRTNGAYDQPFGGVLTITGFIPTAPDISTPAASLLRYRVRVRESGSSAWQTVTSSFWISVIERLGATLPTQYPILQEVGPDGYFTYREDMNSSGAGWRLVQNRVLATWITAEPMIGLYEIMVEAKDPVTNINYSAQSLVCTDGSMRTTVTVELDETAPTCGVDITGFVRGGGPAQPAANCDTFRVGDVIQGTYDLADLHSGGLTLTVEPAASAHGAVPSPSARSYPVMPTVGESGTWQLNTAGMDPCGYVVRIWSWDRTIASGDGSGWKCSESIGFCLNR